MATQAQDTLYIHLLIGSDMTAKLNGEEITLRLEADLKNRNVSLTVVSGRAHGSIAVRKPGWMTGLRYELSQCEPRITEENGYAFFTGDWKPGDRIEWRFEIVPQVIAASPLVKEAQGQVCYTWGPFVFCAEEADNGKQLHLLRACPDMLNSFDLEEKEIGGLSVPVLTVPGKRVKADPAAPLYAPWAPPETEDTRITLIPYFAWNNRGMGEMRVWLHRDA